MSDDPGHPPVTTLAYAILSLLAREPLTGYEISQQLRDPIGLLWQARHSQIYPVLARIKGLGWATSESSHGPGPRPKQRYEATDAGLAAIRDWVEAPAGRHGRDELMLRVYASWVAAPSATLQFLKGAEAHHASRDGRRSDRLGQGLDELAVVELVVEATPR